MTSILALPPLPGWRIILLLFLLCESRKDRTLVRRSFMRRVRLLLAKTGEIRRGRTTRHYTMNTFRVRYLDNLTVYNNGRYTITATAMVTNFCKSRLDMVVVEPDSAIRWTVNKTTLMSRHKAGFIAAHRFQIPRLFRFSMAIS